MVSIRELPVNSDAALFRTVLGVRLRETRLRLGLSQEQFGALGGVAKLAQLNYEKGYRVPDAEYLDKLSRNGVSVPYLLHGVSGPAIQETRLDTDLLAAVLKAVGAVSMAHGHVLSARDFAVAAAALYEQLVGEGNADQSVEQAAAILLAGWSASRKGQP